MPKLKLFAACEKVIIDNENNPILIILMQNVSISLLGKSSEDIPKNAVTPQSWTLFSIWETSKEEEGREFSQMVEIKWPDKTQFKKGELKFKAEKSTQQNRVNFMGFPAGQTGPVEMLLWLELDGNRISEIYSWVVLVSHNAPQPRDCVWM